MLLKDGNYKCDECGKKLSKEEITSSNLPFSPDGTKKLFDYCDACLFKKQKEFRKEINKDYK